VTFLNCIPDSGQIKCALFNDTELTFKNRPPVSAIELQPSDTFRVWQSEPLPYGRYAIAVYQDLNFNDVLDKSFIGRPTEPYGFSNDARSMFGPPRFEAALFEFLAKNDSIMISLM